MFQINHIQSKLMQKRIEEFQNFLQVVFMERMPTLVWQELQR